MHPPSPSFEETNEVLFRARAQAVFGIVAVGATIFVVLGLAMQEPQLRLRLAVKSAIVLVAVGGWWITARGASIGLVRAVVLSVLGFAFTLMAAVGALTGDQQTPALLIAASLVGAAGMLPWAPALQMLAAGIGTLAWLSWRWAVGAEGWFAGAVFLAFAVASPFVSWSLQMQRRAMWQRQEEAQERARRTASISQSLAVAGGELFQHLGHVDLLAHVCRTVRDALHADLVVALVVSEDGTTLRAKAQHGLSDEEWSIYSVVDIPKDIADAIRTRLEAGTSFAFDVDDLVSSEERLERREIARRLGIGPILFVGLQPAGRLAGVVVACRWRDSAYFDEEAMRTAEGLAPLVAASVENQKLLEALGTANRAQFEFLAGMSHELRTPLNVITGYLDMLLDGAAGPLADGQRDLCERVRDSAVQQLELVGEALELSRRDDAGRIPVRREPVDIAALFEELERELSIRRTDDDVSVIWRVDPDVASPLTDLMKLKMIVRNLVENALRYTSQGAVCVTAKLVDGDLIFEVRDTGVGIPEAECSRVFDAFRQLSGHRPSGVGLGLHIVRRLAQALDGTADVTSEVGKGSIFTVRLPSASVDPAK